MTTSKYKFADLSGNQLPINFKLIIGLKITLVKLTDIPRAVSLSLPLFSLHKVMLHGTIRNDDF